MFLVLLWYWLKLHKKNWYGNEQDFETRDIDWNCTTLFDMEMDRVFEPFILIEIAQRFEHIYNDII